MTFPNQFPGFPGQPAPMQGGGYDPMAALYKDIADAAVTTRGIYLEPGFYELRIERCFFLSSNQSGNNFIVESTVRRAAPNDPSQAARFAPGVKVSWTCNLTKHQSAKGNVKGFIAAMLGINPGDKARVDAEITPAVISQATAPGLNPFGGLIVTCQVQHTATKPTPQKPQGGVYSLHSWTSTGQRDPEWKPEPAQAAPALPPPVQAAPALPPFGTAATPPAGQFGAPAGWGAPAAPPPPVPAAFPPPGWHPHPQAPGYFYHEGTREVLTVEQLRAR